MQDVIALWCLGFLACLLAGYLVWLLQSRNLNIPQVWGHPGEVPIGATMLDFESHLSELKGLAEKMHDDRASLTSPDDFGRLDEALAALSEGAQADVAALREAESREKATEGRFSALSRLVEVFRGEVAAAEIVLKEQLERRAAAGDSGVLQNWSEDIGEDVFRAVAVSTRDCMQEISYEFNAAWQQILPKVRGAVGSRKREYRDQLDALRDLQESHDQQGAVLVQAAGIEKRLLEVLLHLERQTVDIQAVCKTLGFFDRKFGNFRDKCHGRWKSTCKRYSSACDSVLQEEAEINAISNSLVKLSHSLHPQLEQLDALVHTFARISENVANVEEFRNYAEDRINDLVTRLVRDVAQKVSALESECSGRLREVCESLQTPGKKLLSLLQFTEDLAVLNELVRSIASDRGLEAPSRLTIAEGDGPALFAIAGESDADWSRLALRSASPIVSEAVSAMTEDKKDDDGRSLAEFPAGGDREARRGPLGFLDSARTSEVDIFGWRDDDFSEGMLEDISSDCLISLTSLATTDAG